MDLVSVIIPTYNRPIYLKRAIDSVLQQTYKNIEIIVVDDNNPNTDARIETEKLIQDYMEINNFIYLQHEKNKNGSAARNTGIRQAGGNYITFLDDDDEMLAENIEKKLSKLKTTKDEIGAVYSGYNKVNNNQVVLKFNAKKEGDLSYDLFCTTLQMGFGSNSLIKSSVFLNIGLFDEKFKRHQDWEFLIRFFKEYKIVSINEILINIYVDDRQNILNIEKYQKQKNDFFNKFKNEVKEFSIEEQKYIYDSHSFQLLVLSIKNKDFKNILKYLMQINILNLYQITLYKIRNKK